MKWVTFGRELEMEDKVDAIIGFEPGLDVPATIEVLDASHGSG